MRMQTPKEGGVTQYATVVFMVTISIILNVHSLSTETTMKILTGPKKLTEIYGI